MERKIEATVELWKIKQDVRRIDGVVIGVLAKLEDSGEVFVDYPSNPLSGFLPARSTVIVEVHNIGKDFSLIHTCVKRFAIFSFLLIEKPRWLNLPEASISFSSTKLMFLVETVGRGTFKFHLETVLRETFL